MLTDGTNENERNNIRGQLGSTNLGVTSGGSGGESQRWCTRVFPPSTPSLLGGGDIIVCVVVQHCAYHVLLQQTNHDICFF